MAAAGHAEAQRWRRTLAGALPLALPLLVWYAGSFYYHGGLGKWLDDYGAQVRDPVTGSFAWSSLFRYQWWFFWRPIHVHLVFVLQTLLWNHDWLNHLFSALMHGTACFALWRFLAACGVRGVVAAGAALVMLGSVQGFEAIHWPATVSTSIATSMFLIAGTLTVRHAQGRVGWGAVAGLGALGFVTPCLYEQPAAAMAALPVLYLGMRAVPSHMAHGEDRLSPLRLPGRVIWFFAPCAAGVAAYLTLYVLSARQQSMAREGRFVAATELWPHAIYVLRTMGVFLDPVRGLEEVWSLGLATLQRSKLGGIGAAIVGVLAGTLWVAGWVRREPPPAVISASRAERAKRDLAIAVMGALAFLLSLFPIAAIGGAGPSPRLAYFPLVCVLIVSAGVLDGVLARLGDRGWAGMCGRAAVAAVAAALTLAGTVHLVGVQQGMRELYWRDMATMDRLRAAAPRPRAGTIFVPIQVAASPLVPGSDRLRNSFQPIWASPWAVNTYIKHVYKRADVNACAIYMHNQSNGIVRLGEPTLISWSHYLWHLPQPRVENTCPAFETALVIPFTVDRTGDVSLVSELRTRAPDGAEMRVAFAQARTSSSPGVARDIAIPIASGRPWLTNWRWPHRGGMEVKFLRVPSWGASERAVRMHPATPGVEIFDGDTDEMTLELAPSDAPRSFVFYSTFDEPTIDLSVKGDGVDLVWSLDADATSGEPAKVLRTVAMDPARAKERRAWETVTVEIPPLRQARMLRLTVGAGAAGNASYDRVLVTCGEDASGPGSGPVASPDPKAND